MKIGIIAAMEKEAVKIIGVMRETKTERISGISYTSGKIGENDVVCAVCGIGKVFAAMCAEVMAVKFLPDCIVNTGVAGTLTHELGIGDVAVSSDTVQYDMDTSALGDPVGLISGINIVKIPASAALGAKISEIAASHGIKTAVGTIASGDRFVSDSETRAKITESFGAIACEMEGAAVGQVCFVNKIPYCVVRAISDNADGEANEDYPAFVAKAVENSAGIVIELAKNLAGIQ